MIVTVWPIETRFAEPQITRWRDTLGTKDGRTYRRLVTPIIAPDEPSLGGRKAPI